MIQKETATDIALAYREIETSQKLLADIEKAQDTVKPVDIRDVFGRPTKTMEVGVPTGDSSRRIFQMDYKLAKPVIEAHIAQCKAKLSALNEKAIAEAKGE